MTDSKPPDPASKPGPAGRVRHDASGRAVWEWAVDTGRHAIDSTSRLLKRLELPGLSLEDDAKKKHDSGISGAKESTPFGGPREADPKAGSRQSFNPYDNRPAKRSASANRSAGRPGARPTAAPAAPRKRGLLARLFGRG